MILKGEVGWRFRYGGAANAICKSIVKVCIRFVSYLFIKALWISSFYFVQVDHLGFILFNLHFQ